MDSRSNLRKTKQNTTGVNELNKFYDPTVTICNISLSK